ncbi:alanine racemase [Hyphomicrobium sulfonivorans]|nr:alanine racemase [Hyphomicrobium sulfonivorans]NSL72089.1 alanine racemase [Hyphomicrobium sulfonivorans]
MLAGSSGPTGEIHLSDRNVLSVPVTRNALHGGALREVAFAPSAAIPASATGVITIDLAQLRANWRALAMHVAPAGCAAVVKADAYGLGAARIVPALYQAGCRNFFVATFDEAAAALKYAPGATVYILDGVMPGAARDIAALGARPVLTSLGEVDAWAALAAQDEAAPPAALHVDTGLHRLGMAEDELEALVADDALMARLDFAVVMSHLACADEASHAMNRQQLETFKRLRAKLPRARASLAASDGLLLGRPFHFDLVRPGYALYGGQANADLKTPVSPVVQVSARILQVQDVPAGGAIGYSATYRAATPRRIATVAAGYADGVFRHASAANGETGGAVIVRGQKAPVVGRVSMDLITIDITDIDGPPPVRGDYVDLVGPRLPLEAVGAGARTIGYEVLTRLGHRFHRHYVDNSD